MTYESPTSIESRERNPHIHLRFSRHEKKEGSKPGISDKEIPLASQGRLDAKESATLTDVSQGLAYGSPRKRALETVAFELLGKQTGITGTESLEELEAKIRAHMKVGTKVLAKSELDFSIDPDSPFGKWIMTRYVQDKDFMRALLLESDQKAEELEDTQAETASVYAGRIARIIMRYIHSQPRWKELVNNPEKNYEDTLTRYFVSHGGVTESFLGKIIERTSGKEELKKFIDLMPNGFDFHEGFELDIAEGSDGKPLITISYEKKGDTPEASYTFTATVPEEVIADLAEGRNVLYEKNV